MSVIKIIGVIQKVCKLGEGRGDPTKSALASMWGKEGPL